MEPNAAMLLDAVTNRVASGEFARVTEVCKQTLMLAREQDSNAVEIASLLGLATSHRYTGKFYEADVFLDGALEMATIHDMTELMAEAIWEDAATKMDAGSRDHEAVDDFKIALKLAHEADYRYGIAKSLYGLSWAYTSIGWHDKALRYAREALEQAQALEHRILQCQCLLMLGAALLGQGDTEKALQTLRHAARIALDGTYYGLEGLAQIGLGHAYARSQRHQTLAYDCYERALQIAQETAWVRLEFATIHSLGTLSQAIGEYETAAAYFSDMLQIAEEIGNPIYEAGGAMSMGKLAIAQEDYEAALQHFTHVLSLSREHLHPVIEASAQEWLAMLHSSLHDYAQALGYLRQARNVYVSLEDGVAARRVTLNLVWTTFALIYDRVLRFVGLRNEDQTN